MKEKAVQVVKGISTAVVEAVCRANYDMGMSDALLSAGLALLLFSAWMRKRSKEEVNKNGRRPQAEN